MSPDEKKVPGGIYQAPNKDDTDAENCNQCFYTGVEADKESQEGDCSQCFYPEPTEEEKKAQAKEAEDCNQCFYKPGK